MASSANHAFTAWGDCGCRSSNPAHLPIIQLVKRPQHLLLLLLLALPSLLLLLAAAQVYPHRF
jgi:hypothetical protein